VVEISIYLSLLKTAVAPSPSSNITSMNSSITFSFLATALFFVCVHAIDKSDYDGKMFKGEGTYYGGSPYSGNCAIRAPLPAGVYEGRLPVAINAKQYEGSCGACVRIKGSGKGSGAHPIEGVIEGYISDKCPECAEGDLDLTGGKDGRWEIEWEFVECKPAKYIEFLFEDFNNYYWKIQPRGMASPAIKLTVDGKDAKFTDDNHWEVSMDDKTEAKVVVTTLLGQVIESNVKAAKGVAIRGGMITSSGETTSMPTTMATPEPKTESAPTDAPKETPVPTSMPTLTPTPSAMPSLMPSAMPIPTEEKAASMVTEKPEVESAALETMAPASKPELSLLEPVETVMSTVVPTPIIEPSMEPEATATPAVGFDSTPLKSIRVFIDGKAAQELYDGEFAEVQLTSSKKVTFECITNGVDVGYVYFDVNGKLEWTETKLPYVLGQYINKTVQP